MMYLIQHNSYKPTVKSKYAKGEAVDTNFISEDKTTFVSVKDNVNTSSGLHTGMERKVWEGHPIRKWVLKDKKQVGEVSGIQSENENWKTVDVEIRGIEKENEYSKTIDGEVRDIQYQKMSIQR